MHNRIFRTTALAAAIAFSPLAMAAGAARAQSAPSTSAAKSQLPAARRSILDELDLTATQQSAIRETMQQNFQQLRPQLQALTQKRQAFETAIPDSAGYQSAVNDYAQADADFVKAETLREGAVRSKVYQLLTPAQRTKLKSLMAEQRARAAGASAPPASH